MTGRGLLARLGLGNLLEFAFPSRCLCCDGDVPSPGDLVCGECWDKSMVSSLTICCTCRRVIPSGGEWCGCPDSEESLPVIALGHYVDPLREIVHQLKYGGYRKIGLELGAHISEKYSGLITLANPDGIIPIPLHRSCERKRGFNQSAIISDIIGNSFNIPVWPEILSRFKKTRDQTRLNLPEREENMRGAFEVPDSLYTGKRIMLIDDVVTTGATLREAARTLRAAGLRPVLAAVVAAAGYE